MKIDEVHALLHLFYILKINWKLSEIVGRFYFDSSMKALHTITTGIENICVMEV